jgi:hypothetical protein
MVAEVYFGGRDVARRRRGTHLRVEQAETKRKTSSSYLSEANRYGLVLGQVLELVFGLLLGCHGQVSPGKFFLLLFFFPFLVLFSGLYFLFNSGLHFPFVLQDFKCVNPFGVYKHTIVNIRALKYFICVVTPLFIKC